MSTDEIAKNIALLKVNTIQDALKQAGASDHAKSSKNDLIKVYENAVMNVGIEKFLSRISDEVALDTANLLAVDANTKGALLAKIQAIGVPTLLAQATVQLLRDYATEMGLAVSNDKKDMEQSIADEVMLTGMEGFLHKLSQPTLKKHCVEISLSSGGEKKDLVERLMVHIFELEPLTQAGTSSSPAEAEEEAKPKETKKRKESVDGKPDKSKKAKKDKKEGSANGDNHAEDESEEKKEKEKKEKKAKKEKASAAAADENGDAAGTEATNGEETPKKTPKKNKSEQEEGDVEEEQEAGDDDDASGGKNGTPSGKREKWVAPPLETIVPGKYDYQGFYDNFNLTDLQHFCKAKGLKGTGVKREIIKEILRFLETGEVTDTAKKGKKKKGKKPGKTPTKNGDAQSETTDSAAAVTTATETKAEPEPATTTADKEKAQD